MNISKSGKVNHEEFNHWISGWTGRLQKARAVTLLQGRTGQLTLDRIEWTPEELHRQLQLMLCWNELSPLDLLRGWDVSGDDGLAFKEWLRMIKRLVSPGEEYAELWDCEIRPVVQQTFRNIAGSNKTVDPVEIENYFNTGWKDAKLRVQKQQIGLEPLDDLMSTIKLSRLGKGWRAKQKATADANAAAGNVPFTEDELPNFRNALRPSPSKRLAPRPSEAAADRAPGWEVREYMSTICKHAEIQRPARLQWKQLTEARRLLDERQHPKVEPKDWWNY